MENYETITASGSAFWGKDYQVDLIKFLKIYKSRSTDYKRELTTFGFRFTASQSHQADVRIFSSEDERSVFMTQNFTNINFIPIKAPQVARTPYILDNVIGEYLSSITFVMDYMQIDFNGYGFIFYNWPIIHSMEIVYEQQDISYRNKFCELIGKKVILVEEFLDLGLVIEFQNGIFINIPLKIEKSFDSISEIAEYSGQKQEWMVWRIGGTPFE